MRTSARSPYTTNIRRERDKSSFNTTNLRGDRINYTTTNHNRKEGSSMSTTHSKAGSREQIKL